MTFLEILAEAVNAVADHPQNSAMCCDEPLNRTLGYAVGMFAWRVPITQIRYELPDLHAKHDQLVRMSKGIRLPLRPYPEQQREREILARRALLKSAVYLTNIEMRRQTASWVTFLGRLRAAPDGSLLGWAGEPVLGGCELLS